jgi:3-oxoacyl-[acyl-carrier-protein] synthase-1
MSYGATDGLWWRATTVSGADVPVAGVYVVGLGASTPIGRDAWSSAAAARAGISAFVEHPYLIDTAGDPMRVAMAPWLEMEVDGTNRFAALLRPALTQALEPLEGARSSAVRVALALALPIPRPGLPDNLERALRASVVTEFPNRFSTIVTFPSGHAAGFVAMRAVCEKIAVSAFDACVVAGVDSYLSPDTLEWLESNDQLHSAGTLNNAWGFIPGEGAGAALLVNENVASRLRADPLATVLSVGTGFEPNRIKTETVCIGEGLTAAFRRGLSGLPLGAQVTDVFCDMNGEPYRADEFGFACLRTKEAFVSASDFVAPAEIWGDVSAASGPLCVVLSVVAGKKAYANGSYAFLWASSESGERGASLLGLPASDGN